MIDYYGYFHDCGDGYNDGDAAVAAATAEVMVDTASAVGGLIWL